MDEYIKKPDYIDNINNIKSNNLMEINFSKYLLPHTNGVYNLNLLRELYSSDIEKFLNIRDELLLRGFEIKTSKPSNLFPEIRKSNNKKIIYSNQSSERYDKYKNIDFSLLGIGNITHRLKIDSDSFFDLIILDNFRYINDGVNLSLLETYFINSGFKIKPLDTISSSDILYFSKESNKEFNTKQNTGNFNSISKTQSINNSSNNKDEIIDALDNGTSNDNSILQQWINVLDLSKRAYNSLRRNGIETVGKLVTMGKDDLMNLHGLGKKP